MRHEDQLNRSMPVQAKGSSKTWTTSSVRVSAMRREDAGVDCDEPWIASCDSHGEMLGCPTKASAIESCRSRDWCSKCSEHRRVDQEAKPE